MSKIECQRLEQSQRREHTELPSGVHIRDQCPQPPTPLESCLVDMTPADWYALINSRVFFWLDYERLNRQRTACEPRPQIVPTPLEVCLVDMEPADWYALINSRVFIWLDYERLNRQRKACEPRPQALLDAAALVAAHGDRIAVTPINTGNAKCQPDRSGRATFVPYSEWLVQRGDWPKQSHRA
jgi:hypothetical protein